MPKHKSPVPPLVPLLGLVPRDTHVMVVLPADLALRCVNHNMNTIGALSLATDDDLRDQYQFPKHEIDQISSLLAGYGMIRGPRSPELSPPYRR